MTDTINNIIAKLASEFRSDAEIADITGLTLASVIHRRKTDGIKAGRAQMMDHRKAIVAKGVADGKSDVQIAKENNLSTSSVQQIRCRNLGLAPGVVPEDRAKTMRIAEIRKMAARGMSDSQIAEVIGVSRHTVFERRKKFGVPAYNMPREPEPLPATSNLDAIRRAKEQLAKLRQAFSPSALPVSQELLRKVMEAEAAQ